MISERFITARDFIKWIAIIIYSGGLLYQVDQRSKKYRSNVTKPIFHGKYPIELEERKRAIILNQIKTP